jgi:hypothetical protein
LDMLRAIEHRAVVERQKDRADRDIAHNTLVSTSLIENPHHLIHGRESEALLVRQRACP